MLMRIIRFLIGVILLPVCWVATIVVINLTRLIQPESTDMVPPSALALGGGFALWVFIFLVMPRPVRTYILAHELTHALWGVWRGASVKSMKITRDQGSVTLSKSDFLITLAPYFFPLYTVIVIITYYVLSLFFELERYELYWLGLVGLTWGFHFSFTITTLLQHQSDIRAYGHMFSYAIIYLFNVVGIAIWILLVSAVTIEQSVNCVVLGWEHVASQIVQIIPAIKL